MEKFFHLLTLCLSSVILPGTLSGQDIIARQSGFNSESGAKGTVPLMMLAATFTETPELPDNTVIYFDEKATNEFDGQLDAFKAMNSDFRIPSLFTVTPTGINLSINALPPICDGLCKVPLGLKTDINGSVTIKIRDIDPALSQMKIFLTDVVAGTDRILFANEEYMIYLPSGEYRDRFFISLSNMTTDIDSEVSGNEVFSAYSSYGLLMAEINSLMGKDGTLRVFNLLGQVLFVSNVYETGHHEFSPGLKEGIYIITYNSGNYLISKKILVKN